MRDEAVAPRKGIDDMSRVEHRSYTTHKVCSTIRNTHLLPSTRNNSSTMLIKACISFWLEVVQAGEKCTKDHLIYGHKSFSLILTSDAQRKTFSSFTRLSPNAINFTLPPYGQERIRSTDDLFTCQSSHRKLFFGQHVSEIYVKQSRTWLLSTYGS